MRDNVRDNTHVTFKRALRRLIHGGRKLARVGKRQTERGHRWTPNAGATGAGGRDRDADAAELLACYDAMTRDRRQVLLFTARAMADASKMAPNVVSFKTRGEWGESDTTGDE